MGYWGYLQRLFWDITPIMENQLGKKMEHERSLSEGNFDSSPHGFSKLGVQGLRSYPSQAPITHDDPY